MVIIFIVFIGLMFLWSMFMIVCWIALRRQAPSGSDQAPPRLEKKCPACAEMIKSEALVCKHCGHEQNPSEQESRVKTQVENPEVKSKSGLDL